MQRTATALLTLLCCLLSLAVAQEPAVTVDRVAEDLDRHYNDLRSLRAEFTETYRGAGITRTESGTLWLRRPGKMRWEYVEPREKLFVSDGKVAYFYVPGERQARKAPLDKLDDLRSPLRYLLGKTKLKKEFDNLTARAGDQPGVVVVRGVPRNMSDRVSEVSLDVNSAGEIQRIQIEELDGSETEFTFSSMQENVAVEDARFRFQPPPGVELIEGTATAP